MQVQVSLYLHNMPQIKPALCQTYNKGVSGEKQKLFQQDFDLSYPFLKAISIFLFGCQESIQITSLRQTFPK